jgi:predicted Zn-dependent protease
LAPDDLSILEDIAQSQMACGNYAEAEFAASQLLDKEQNKDRRDLKLMRARCLMALNRPVESRSVLLELTADREAGRDYQVWVELGNCAVVLKDKPHLRLAGMRAVALAPDRFEGYTLKALYNRLEGRSEEALAAIDESVKRCDGDPNPYMVRALILQDLGRPFEAKQTLEQAMAKNPGSPRLQVMLSAIEKQTGSGGSAVTGVDESSQSPQP